MTDFGPKEMFELLRNDLREFAEKIDGTLKNHEERIRQGELKDSERAGWKTVAIWFGSAASAALVSAFVAGMYS